MHEFSSPHKLPAPHRQRTMTLRTVNITVMLLFKLLLLFVVATTKSAQGFLFSDSILFARLRCFLAFQRFGFNISDFPSYPKYFRNDSIMELAQAGVYQGAANIEEYVKFVYSDFSPYLSCCNDYIDRQVKFLGYANGQCEFLSIYNGIFETTPNATAEIPARFQVVAGLKLYFDFNERYVKRINVHYTDDFLRVYFDVLLNSPNTREFVCGVMNGPCANILNVTSNCTEQLLTLPSAEGEQYFIDGKSQGCRVLHAVFANTNPDNHCAHLSFTPLEDPNGSIKCQTSKGTLPSSLFTERELQLFKDFAESVGVDPVLGHTLVE